MTSTVSPARGPAPMEDVSAAITATPGGCRTITPLSVWTRAPASTLPTLSASGLGSLRKAPPSSIVQSPYLQHSNGQAPRTMYSSSNTELWATAVTGSGGGGSETAVVSAAL